VEIYVQGDRGHDHSFAGLSSYLAHMCIILQYYRTVQFEWTHGLGSMPDVSESFGVDVAAHVGLRVTSDVEADETFNLLPRRNS
jgi:hypothetical protein